MPKTLRALCTSLLLGLSALAQGGAGDAGCEFADPDRGKRPSAGQAVSEVSVGVYLLDLPRIDDADQSFLADVFFRFEWRDARLTHSGSSPCVVTPGGYLASAHPDSQPARRAGSA